VDHVELAICRYGELRGMREKLFGQSQEIDSDEYDRFFLAVGDVVHESSGGGFAWRRQVCA